MKLFMWEEGGGAIYKSTDDGISWSLVYRNDNNSVIASIAEAPDGSIYATSTNEGVIKSTDKGASWQIIKPGPHNNLMQQISIDSKGKIYAGLYNEGISYSTDNGDTWVLDTSGLKLVPLMSITIDGKDNVYLSTEESVWRSNPDSIVSVAGNPDIPTEYKLYQNYPNPFNPTTTIRYSVKEAGMVTLTVYDILGKEIKTLVNETKSPGEYTATFDGSSLSSGVYTYTIRAGTFNASRKLVLVK
jgi:hypothetical protein